MAIWEGLQAAAETLRKADKIPEYKEILAAMDTIRELQCDLFDATERIRILEAELAKKSEIEGPVPPFGYFFDKKHPDSPLCPKCYQSKESRISFMGPLHAWNGGMRRDCRLCGHAIFEKEMNFNQKQLQIRRM